jgi:hypothetical protein
METHEKPNPQEATSGNQEPEIRQAPDFITVYSTSVRVAYSEYDVRIFLGDVVFPNPSEKRDKEVVQERVCIVLPLECAESLEALLGEVTFNFESEYGRRQTSK